MAEDHTDEVVNLKASPIGSGHCPPRLDQWRGEDGSVEQNTRNEATILEGLNLWPSGFILYAGQQLGRGALPHWKILTQKRQELRRGFGRQRDTKQMGRESS